MALYSLFAPANIYSYLDRALLFSAAFRLCSFFILLVSCKVAEIDFLGICDCSLLLTSASGLPVLPLSSVFIFKGLSDSAVYQLKIRYG